MRTITDTTFAMIVKMLMADEKVQLFQQLVTSPKVEEVKAEENKEGE